MSRELRLLLLKTVGCTHVFTQFSNLAISTAASVYKMQVWSQPEYFSESIQMSALTVVKYQILTECSL